MQVFDILKESKKRVKIQEETLENEFDHNEWAKTFFEAPSYKVFMTYYIQESKDLIKQYNDFCRKYRDEILPATIKETANDMKDALKFAQSFYRNTELTEGVRGLSEEVAYSVRKTWGDFPMFREFLESAKKDMARLYKK